MISRLLIQNYALIDNLEMNFPDGLNVITGETGAGKSIIMDALSLALGQRADAASLRDGDKKCIVEVEFMVGNYGLEDFFKSNDLDAENTCLVRREINSQGRSRAFINDTPVNISVLKELSSLLVDVHSQHQTVEFTQPVNQLEVLDQVAGNRSLKLNYTKQFVSYKAAEQKLNTLLESEAKLKRDHDYYKFLFEELKSVELRAGELPELEAEVNQLLHAEEIKLKLTEASQGLSGDAGLLFQAKEVLQLLEKAGKNHNGAQVLAHRIKTLIIELKDLADETETEAEKSVADPKRLQLAEDRLNSINGLIMKHRVQNGDELLTLMADFESRVQQAESFDEEIEKLRKECDILLKALMKTANEISDSRKKAAAELTNEVKKMLADLKMQGALLDIQLEKLEIPSQTGMDKVLFLFQANKGSGLKEIHKVASGGEFSRLMLAIKSVTGKKNKLPTVIFDEIDTGVSGEVAGKMGAVMKNLGKTMQVFSITHLPQVAVKGDHHYKVVKEEKKNRTVSRMIELSDKEREEEIAKMLSGEKITSEALANARALLK